MLRVYRFHFSCFAVVCVSNHNFAEINIFGRNIYTRSRHEQLSISAHICMLKRYDVKCFARLLRVRHRVRFTTRCTQLTACLSVFAHFNWCTSINFPNYVSCQNVFDPFGHKSCQFFDFPESLSSFSALIQYRLSLTYFLRCWCMSQI